jgi:LPXTG-motif cell wall-anchored protein
VLLAGLCTFFVLLPIAAAAPLAAETKSVSIVDFDFAPKDVTVKVGDTVAWKNNGKAPHTATANNGAFDSGRMNAGQEFSFTFQQAGTFEYVCSFHDTMVAKVTVQEIGSAQPAPAQAAPAQAATGSLEVADQPLMNGAVSVAKVTAGQAGWVVVHLDENGTPGKVLGQTAVKAGETANVMVALNQNVDAGTSLWPMLHIDAGAVGTYEFPGADTPVMGADGKPVMKKIAVAAAAAAPAAAPANSPASQPTQLPQTGGESLPVGVSLAALALLLGGAFVLLRARRT